MELSMTINTPYGYCGIVSGRNILMSSNQGNLKPEQVEELTRNLLKLSFNFRGQPFAYIADPTKLNPIISIETSAEFAKLHLALEKAGCKAVAFLDSNTVLMKRQSQKHQKQSEAKEIQVQHFKTFEEALDWFEQMGV